jgi:ATP-dependent Clp protease ATP-binding subunit ClpC
MMRFDRFTERAQDAAARADEVLQRYGHNQVDTEHILLALLEQSEGVIPQILDRLSVDQNLIKKRLDDVLRASPKGAATYGGGTGQVFITPRVKRVIDLANEEANRLSDDYISPVHMFLAMLSERHTAVASILSEAGVTKEQIRAVMGERLREEAAQPEPLKTVRLLMELPLATVLDLIDQLSMDDARQVYERLRARFEK